MKTVVVLFIVMALAHVMISIGHFGNVVEDIALVGELMGSWAIFKILNQRSGDFKKTKQDLLSKFDA